MVLLSAGRRLAAIAVGSLALGLGFAARADVPAVPFVRRLASAARVHPLADETGRIPVLARLPPTADAAAFGLLPVAPGLGAIRLAPDDLLAFAAAHPDLALRAAPPRHLLLDRSKQWTRAEEYRNASGLGGEGIVVGVIDTGLDVAHPDFRDETGKTRVAWMLRYGPPLGIHTDLETKYGCNKPGQANCGILDADDINAMFATASADVPRDTHGHGTHVTSIAAGNGGVMPAGPDRKIGGNCGAGGACDEGACQTIDGRAYCTKACTMAQDCPSRMHCTPVDNVKTCVMSAPRFVGVAPKATLIVAAPSPPDGGFFDADVLNAARFIFDRADELGKPAVVNISIGSDFGPHDGTSSLETGLASYVGDDKPGRAIVVAAGNSGSLYRVEGQGPLGIHTEAHVSRDAVTRVPIYSPEVKNGTAFVWVTFRPGDEVDVALDGPGGHSWIGFTGPGEEDGYKDDNVSAALINNIVTDKSPIEAGTNSAVVSFQGKWPLSNDAAVLLRGHGDASLWLSAEGDAGVGTTIGVQFMKGTKEGTINVPATHPSLLAVGCTINRIDWVPLGGSPIVLSSFGPDADPKADGTCYFSSAGPTPFGVPKPELSAPGGFVAAAMSAGADPRTHAGGLFDSAGCPAGTADCFVVDDDHAISAGTSMSAPHVAGAVALLLQRNPNLTQARITDILDAGARYPQGHVPYDFQLGPGELDVVGAAAALANEEASFQEPDVSQSWYVLSSAYARPDPTWPVWGTIELRHGDGSIAGGIDGRKLTLTLQTAVVVQPLTKIRQGLWRFAVSAPPGTSGQTMKIDVAYDGASLGARTLDIGTDIWTAKGGMDAVGGCACETGPRPARGIAGWISLVALAALASAASRRRAAKRTPKCYQPTPR